GPIHRAAARSRGHSSPGRRKGRSNAHADDPVHGAPQGHRVADGAANGNGSAGTDPTGGSATARNSAGSTAARANSATTAPNDATSVAASELILVGLTSPAGPVGLRGFLLHWNFALCILRTTV